MKKNLFLHIGSHKTGTTSIQHALISNKEYLNNNNFSFFSEHTNNKYLKTGNTSDWVYIDAQKIKNGFGSETKYLDRLSKKLYSLPNDNIIMSAESFSFFLTKKPIKKLYLELNKYFENIKIIVYLRRQDEQVISHHQEESKGHNGSGNIFFGSDPLSIPSIEKHHYYYLNYYKRISLWADIFGKENIIVRNFDRKTLKNNDVVSDFFSIFDLEISENKSFSLNESNGFQKTKIGHLLNEHIKNDKLRHHLLNSLSNEGKLMPSKSIAIEYFDNFRESNKKLEEYYDIKFNDNFDKYPEKREDIWDEETANLAISNLLLAINEYDQKQHNNCFKSYFRCIKFKLNCLLQKINRFKKYPKQKSCY